MENEEEQERNTDNSRREKKNRLKMVKGFPAFASRSASDQ